MKGWQCSKCDKCYAPWVPECESCNAMESVSVPFVYIPPTCTCGSSAGNGVCPIHGGITWTISTTDPMFTTTWYRAG
jgi:hypothetical protein